MDVKRNEKLRLARILAHLSQDELGLQANIDQSKISRIERGYIQPSAKERQKLAEVLSQKEELLFDGD
jgi:transcriptional regulator with XRE-family HTH domain